jgi:hypothetical protein
MPLCKCGCGQFCIYDFVRGHNNNLRKGKSHEEIFGKECAKLMDQSNSEKHKGKFKGMTNIQKFGEEKAKEISEKIKFANKEMYDKKRGSTYEEIYGKEQAIQEKEKRWNKIKEINPMFQKGLREKVFGEEKAKLIGQKISASCKGRIPHNKGKTYKEEYGEEKAQILLEHNRIIHQKYTDEELRLICTNLMAQYNNNLTRGEFDEKIRIIKGIHPETIRLRQTVDDFIFVRPDTHGKRLGHIGLNEERILDMIESMFGIPFNRQVRLSTNNKFYYLDGYNPDHNIHIEVNEGYHKYIQDQDLTRLEEIQSVLHCQTFVFEEGDNKFIY